MRVQKVPLISSFVLISCFCGFKKPWIAISWVRHWEQLKSTVIFSRSWTWIWKDQVLLKWVIKIQAWVQFLPACLLPLWVNKCFQSHGALRTLKQLINRADLHGMKPVCSRPLWNPSFPRLSEQEGALGIGLWHSAPCLWKKITFSTGTLGENSAFNNNKQKKSFMVTTMKKQMNIFSCSDCDSQLACEWTKAWCIPLTHCPVKYRLGERAC